MKYNMESDQEKEQAAKYFDKLYHTDKIIELKIVRKQRTLNQNSYLHLLLTDFALYFGYTLEEAKHLFKVLNKDIFEYNSSNNNKVVFMRSTADLDTKELTVAIDRFMQASAKQGHELPVTPSNDYANYIENEMESKQQWL